MVRVGIGASLWQAAKKRGLAGLPGPKVDLKSPEGDLKREAIRRESDRAEKERKLAEQKAKRDQLAEYKEAVRWRGKERVRQRRSTLATHARRGCASFGAFNGVPVAGPVRVLNAHAAVLHRRRYGKRRQLRRGRQNSRKMRH